MALGDATCVAFVNGRPQRGQFRLVLLLFTLQSPQPGADHFTCIFVTPALDLRGYVAVEFFS